MQMREELRAAFNEAYASLNAAQKQAVDTIDGPVMVIAGPGTGKTQILTLRIAKILLETDTRPENILALTFTEAGAKAMRQRLHRYIGSDAYLVGIYTFHGFAGRLIRDYPDAFSRIIGGRPASELDRISIIEGILTSEDFTVLRPVGDPTYYVAPIIRTITTLKQEYISPDGLAVIINGQEKELDSIEQYHTKGAHKGKVRSEYTNKEKSIAKNKELLTIYRLYEAALREARIFDFDDMIIETVSALEKREDLLRDLQETYQYILADEHQDVNGSQNKILALLCQFHEQPNIFVVGDEKQAIYRFQGASLENFLYFEDIFSATTKISLTENYRSGQTILDAAHSLVAVEEGPLRDLRIPLTAAAVEKSKLTVAPFDHQAVEDDWVVASIKEQLAAGTPAEDIVVIVRTNREVAAFSAALKKAGIAVLPSAESDILEHPITLAVETLLRAVAKPEDEQALFAVMHAAYTGVLPEDLVRVARAQNYQSSLYTLLSDSSRRSALGLVSEPAIIKLIETLAAARAKSTTETPHRVMEYVLQESGLIAHVMRVDPVDGGRVIRRLYDEVEQLVQNDPTANLATVGALFTRYRQNRIALTAPFIQVSQQAVSVMTAHKSKGLEFAVVYVPHLTDSLWGGATRKASFDIPLTKHLHADDFSAADDELRLLYVAMTRAKSALYLSHSGTNTEGKELLPSRLLDRVVSETLTILSTQSLTEAFDPLATFSQPLLPVAIDAALLKAHIAERGLSATGLNNFLKSPYDYLYRNVLRIPEVQTLPLLYGTAIHGVMEWVSSVVAREGKVPNTQALGEQLSVQLGRLPLSTTEFTQLHEKGLLALTLYTEQCAGTIPKDAKVEFAVKVNLPTGLPDLPEVMLTGKLDRLDFDTDGKLQQVVDYKTGKPKTRNEIEGKTKNSNGEYKRQLTFYALLLELLDDERYACRTGLLSFIEPDSKGRIHEELFTITDEDVAILKEEIIAAVKNISTGAFLKEACDSAVSDYCELAAQLRR